MITDEKRKTIEDAIRLTDPEQFHRRRLQIIVPIMMLLAWVCGFVFAWAFFA